MITIKQHAKQAIITVAIFAAMLLICLCFMVQAEDRPVVCQKGFDVYLCCPTPEKELTSKDICEQLESDQIEIVAHRNSLHRDDLKRDKLWIEYWQMDRLLDKYCRTK